MIVRPRMFPNIRLAAKESTQGKVKVTKNKFPQNPQRSLRAVCYRGSRHRLAFMRMRLNFFPLPNGLLPADTGFLIVLAEAVSRH